MISLENYDYSFTRGTHAGISHRVGVRLIRLALFSAIENGLLANDPLLLKRLKATCKQRIVGYTTQFDGERAWKHIEGMNEPYHGAIAWRGARS